MEVMTKERVEALQDALDNDKPYPGRCAAEPDTDRAIVAECLREIWRLRQGLIRTRHYCSVDQVGTAERVADATLSRRV